MKQFLLIFGAQYAIFLSVLIGGLYFLYQSREKKKELIVRGILTAIIVGLGAFLAGHIYYNPRPFVVGNFIPLVPHSVNNGFPSDHVLLASFIAAVLSFYNRKTAVILWILVVVVAISRVLVGVHHPVDVVGSIVISIIGSAIGYIIIKKFKSDR